MRLVVEGDGELFRLAVFEDGVKRPLLRRGEAPSWAGGWAGVDGIGGYSRSEAEALLLEFGLGTEAALEVLERAAAHRRHAPQTS